MVCLRTRRGRGAEEVKVEAPTMFDVVAEPVPDDAPFFYRVESLERGPGFNLILLSLDGRSTTRTVDFLDDCDVFFSITVAASPLFLRSSRFFSGCSLYDAASSSTHRARGVGIDGIDSGWRHWFGGVGRPASPVPDTASLLWFGR